MRRVLWLPALIILVIVNSVLHGQDNKALWLEASQHYNDGNFTEAIDNYHQLLAEGYVSEQLYYNLGNAQLNNGDLAEAILSYERARLLDPNDSDIAHNLSVANSRIENRIVAVEQFFLVRWFYTVVSFMSPFAWGVLFILFLWITVLLVTGFGRWNRPGNRPLLQYFCGAAAVLSLVFGIVSFSLSKGHGDAIVMESGDVLVAPDEESPILRQVGAGEKVRILDSLDSFYKLRLPNYEEGWLPVEVVEQI